MESIDKYFETALTLLKASGYFITENLHGSNATEQESDNTDLVTEKKVERTLIEGLYSKFPTHKFISEKTMYEGGKCDLTDAPTWIIDPGDGTFNFIHGFPHCCISVGLVINKECVAGIIYNPNLQQLFTAKKGQGAYLNGKQIHVSNIKELHKALLAFECGTSGDGRRFKAAFQNIKRIVRKGIAMRSLGSAALNMAMVAMGGADANFEYGIHVWDMAAGLVLVQEAGGVCRDPAGGPFDILLRRVLCASTAELANEVAHNLTHFYAPRE